MDLNDDGRKELGITTVMPTSIDESIAALKADTELQELLGKVFVKRYIAVRQGEQRLLNSMSETKRRNWLIEKY